MAKIRTNLKLSKAIHNAQKIKELKSQKRPKSFSVSFYERASGIIGVRSNIYCTLQHGNDNLKFSTGESCPKGKLSSNGAIEDQPHSTAKLQEWKHRAEQLAAHFLLTGVPIDMETIKAALRGDTLVEDTVTTVQELYERYAEYEKSRLETSQTAIRTYWKNLRWAKDFLAFTNDRYGAKALLDDLKPDHIKQFVFWLRKTRNLSNNTAQATASHARAMMNFAFDNEWIERNPFINFRRKMDEVTRTTLTRAEVERLGFLPLENPSLTIVRDIFFFMCLTGLPYCETKDLTVKELLVSADKERYLCVDRQKMRSRNSKLPAIIPLESAAIVILNKYWPGDMETPIFPMQANAPFNKCLKQIAFIAGLQKSISTKVARNSLATYLLNEGVPLPTISAILGHTNTLTTQKYYAKIQPETVIRNFRELQEKNQSTNPQKA